MSVDASEMQAPQDHGESECPDTKPDVGTSNNQSINTMEVASIGIGPDNSEMISIIPTINSSSHHVFFDGSNDVRDLSQELD